jgi:hypothetical protein
MALVAGNLRASLERPATVSFRRRLISVAVPLVMALIAGLVGARADRHETKRFDEQWALAYPGVASPREIVEIHEYADTAETRGHCLTILAARYRDAAKNDDFWKQPAIIATSAGLTTRDLIRSAVEALPNATEGEAAAAEKAIKREIREHRRFVEFAPLLVPVGLGAFVLAVGALISFVWSAITGVPPLLRLNDLAIVRADGRPASRFRVILRTILGWLPVVIAGIAAAVASSLPAEDFRKASLVTIAGLLAALVGAALCLRRTDRGPHDKLIGTWLVPQ